MLHAARQLPSWLIFDVRQSKGHMRVMREIAQTGRCGAMRSPRFHAFSIRGARAISRQSIGSGSVRLHFSIPASPEKKWGSHLFLDQRACHPCTRSPRFSPNKALEPTPGAVTLRAPSRTTELKRLNAEPNPTQRARSRRGSSLTLGVSAPSPAALCLGSAEGIPRRRKRLGKGSLPPNTLGGQASESELVVPAVWPWSSHVIAPRFLTVFRLPPGFG